MERTWYLRLAIVLLLVTGAVLVLWPTMYDLALQKHTVREGETLAALATRYETTPDEIIRINELRSRQLQRGQRLRVPGWFPGPSWIMNNIDRRIIPGLDIQGGLRMMYTVDMDSAVEDRRNARAQQILRRLGEKMDIIEEDEAPDEAQLDRIRQRVTAQYSTSNPRLIMLRFESPADLELLDRDLVRSFGDLAESGRTENTVSLVLTEASIDALRTLAVNQAQETIKNRIAEMGLQEANVRAQDIDIVVEVPGASEEHFQRIRDIISQTARLEFQIVDDANTFTTTLTDLPEGIQHAGGYLLAEGLGPCPEGVEPDARGDRCTAHTRLAAYVEQVRQSGRVPDGRELAIGRMDVDDAASDDEESSSDDGEGATAWRTYVLYEQPPNGSDPVGGEHLEDAAVGTDPQTNEPLVTFAMNPEGARRMQELTSANMQRQMAIVLDDEVESAPSIRGRIGARGQITLGGFRDYNTLLNEANELVIVLRAGALPAPIIAQNEQLIGPTLGQESVVAGAQGAIAGILIVVLFMCTYYSVAGVVASGMVLLNLLFLFAMMAFFNNDMTLPGLAGIALTVGMAVDANVLINERMRDELRAGKSARAAVEQGYRRAFWAIFDGQLTTAIAGVVLLQYGSPEIQGFGRTLLIGIISSLFTSVFCSKVAFDWMVKGLKVSKLRVG